jgi:RNA polymerase sigma-70 factor (ECF subfamily)
MADDRQSHRPSLTSRHATALEHMMAVVSVPPFEEFYATNRDRVYRLLVRRVGRQQAEDAFQETFLRALRAYPRLRHADQLGAWVTTIAERVVIDAHRRSTSTTELHDGEAWDGRPPHAELEHLAGELPPTERAAVVLRYGYDLDYDQIGAVLGSNATAARQAASAGVRRLRKELT